MKQTSGYHLAILENMVKTELMPAIKKKNEISQMSTVLLPPVKKQLLLIQPPLKPECRRATSALLRQISAENAQRAISKLIYEYIFLNKCMPLTIASTRKICLALAQNKYHAWASDQWGGLIKIFVIVDPHIAVEGSIIVR